MQSYKEYKQEVKEAQSDKSYDEIKEQMKKQSEFMVELDNLKPIKHNWVDRGAKLSCENAGHAYHQAWKRIGRSQ